MKRAVMLVRNRGISYWGRELNPTSRATFSTTSLHDCIISSICETTDFNSLVRKRLNIVFNIYNYIYIYILQ